MDRHGLHTRIVNGRIDDYVRAHSAIPISLADALHAAGVTEWTIWRDGYDLFHNIEGAGFVQLQQALQGNIHDGDWQSKIGPLVEPGKVAPLQLVWSLSRNQRSS